MPWRPLLSIGPLGPHPLPAPCASGSPLKGSQTWLVTWTLRRPQGGCPAARSCGEARAPQSDPPPRSRLVCQVENGSAGCCPRTGVCRKRGDPRGWPSWNLSTLIPSIAARERVPAALHTALDEGTALFPASICPCVQWAEEARPLGIICGGRVSGPETPGSRAPPGGSDVQKPRAWGGPNQPGWGLSGSALRCDSGGPP